MGSAATRLLLCFGLLTGFVCAQTHTEVTLEDTQTISGAKTLNGEGAAGNIALKNASVSNDGVQYVSSTGSDSNDGLSWGTAKASISSAYSNLATNGTCTPLPPKGSGNVTMPCGVIYLGNAAGGGYSISSQLSIVGSAVRIVGVGTQPTLIKCTGSITCIDFNNSSTFYGIPHNGDYGLQNVIIEGDGSANQTLVEADDAIGIEFKDVRLVGASGTSSVGLEFLADIAGSGCNATNPCYIERSKLFGVWFDNDTTGFLVTTSGATASASFGHNEWQWLQFTLQNGQTAVSLQNYAAVYSSEFSGVFNTAGPNTNSYTVFNLGTNASFKGLLNVALDNGGGGTVTSCTGCTSSNFNYWGFGLTNSSQLSVQDGGQILNFTSNTASGGLGFAASGTLKHGFYLDPSNCLGDWNYAGSSEIFSICPSLLTTTAQSVGGGISFPTGLGAITHITGPSDQPLSIQPGSGKSAQVSGEYYLGNNTLASAISSAPSQNDILIDANVTIGANLTITKTNLHLHCVPGITITYTGSFQIAINAQHVEIDHCSFIGQGVNTAITTQPICWGCSGNDGSYGYEHDNSFNGFGSGQNVNQAGICNYCKFIHNFTGNVGVGTAVTLSASSAPTVAAPASGRILSVVTYFTSNTQNFAVGNSVKITGFTASNSALNQDDCVITALTTNTSFACDDENVIPSASYTAQAATAVQVGNVGEFLYVNNNQTGKIVTDIQIKDNRVDEIQLHVTGSTAPCPQINNTIVSGNIMHAGMNNNANFGNEAGDFSSSCQSPDNFKDYQSIDNEVHLDSDGTNGGYSFSTVGNFIQVGDKFNSHCHPYQIYGFEHIAAVRGTITGVISDDCGGGGGIDLNRGNWTNITGSVVYDPCPGWNSGGDCTGGAGPRSGIAIGSNTTGQVFTGSHNTVTGNQVVTRVDLCPTTVAGTPGNCTAAGAVGNGTTVTFTTQRRHPYHVGDTVYINGNSTFNATGGCAVQSSPAPTTSVPYQFSVLASCAGVTVTSDGGGYTGSYEPTGNQIGAIEVASNGSTAFTQFNKVAQNKIDGYTGTAAGTGIVCGINSSSTTSDNSFIGNDVDGYGIGFVNNGCVRTTFQPGQITNVAQSQNTINSGTYAKAEQVGVCTFSSSTTCAIIYPNTFTCASTPSVFIEPQVAAASETFYISASSATGFTITASASNSTAVPFDSKCYPSISTSGTPF